MPFSALPGVLALRRVYEAGTLQPRIAEALGCSQAFISNVLAGKQRLGPTYRSKARDSFGIAVSDWLTAEERGEAPADPSDPSDDASHSETPQAARTSSIPPRSDSEHAGACPVEAA